MSKIEVNLTLRFNIPDEDLNVNGLLFGLKAVSEMMNRNLFIDTSSDFSFFKCDLNA